MEKCICLFLLLFFFFKEVCKAQSVKLSSSKLKSALLFTHFQASIYLFHLQQFKILVTLCVD